MAIGRLGKSANYRSVVGAILVAALCAFLAGPGCPSSGASEEQAAHVVVLADPHVPGKFLAAKTAVIERINGWADVDRVVVLGDICEDRGTAEEYAFAKEFFSALRKPGEYLVGNHDYIYQDGMTAKGGRIRGSPESRAAKLQRFREAFRRDEVYSSRRIGNYLFAFLSTDHLLSPHPTHISDRQLDWLREELGRHRDVPTVIFFHAPLRGTLHDFNDRANKDDFVAQPREALEGILRDNRQVFLWVAGHMHVSAANESYRSPVNMFQNHVTAVHVTDMQRERIWSTSLFLFPDRVVVKTFDHKKGAWVEALERTVKPGQP